MFTVKMGPIPGLPAWHQQSSDCSYQFPTLQAAEQFAASHSARDPLRLVQIEEA